VAQDSLQNDRDKELSILSLLEELAYVISTQVAVYVETLIQEQLDEFLTVGSNQSLLEYIMLDLYLGVIVALKDLGQGQAWTIPVESETEISF
jgi:hypothetical protein